MANVRVTMNRGNIHQLLHSPEGPVHREVDSKRRKVEAIATATAPNRDGRLKNARNGGVRDEGNRLVGFVEFTVEYAIYHVKGTGIYGPRGRPITPKKAKALVFRTRGGDLVYAKSVKGIRPNPFLVNALRTGAAPWPVTEH